MQYLSPYTRKCLQECKMTTQFLSIHPNMPFWLMTQLHVFYTYVEAFNQISLSGQLGI